jgi:hypothetical protein
MRVNVKDVAECVDIRRDAKQYLLHRRTCRIVVPSIRKNTIRRARIRKDIKVVVAQQTFL